jgi:hypothetical protein
VRIDRLRFEQQLESDDAVTTPKCDHRPSVNLKHLLAPFHMRSQHTTTISDVGKDVGSEKEKRWAHKMPNGTESTLVFLLFEAAASDDISPRRMQRVYSATIARSIVTLSLETPGLYKDSHITVSGKARWQSLSNTMLPNSRLLTFAIPYTILFFPE